MVYKEKEKKLPGECKIFNDLYDIEKKFTRDDLTTKLIIQDNVARGYRVFNSREEFWKYSDMVQKSLRCFSEIIYDSSPQFPKVQVELASPFQLPKNRIIKPLREIINGMLEEFSALYSNKRNIPKSSKDLVVMEESGCGLFGYWSYKFHIQPTTFYVANHKEATKFTDNVRLRVSKEVGCLFDPSYLEPIQCVRVIDSTYLRFSLHKKISSFSKYLGTAVDVHRNELFVKHFPGVPSITNPELVTDNTPEIISVSHTSSMIDGYQDTSDTHSISSISSPTDVIQRNDDVNIIQESLIIDNNEEKIMNVLQEIIQTHEDSESEEKGSAIDQICQSETDNALRSTIGKNHNPESSILANSDGRSDNNIISIERRNKPVSLNTSYVLSKSSTPFAGMNIDELINLFCPCIKLSDKFLWNGPHSNSRHKQSMNRQEIRVYDNYIKTRMKFSSPHYYSIEKRKSDTIVHHTQLVQTWKHTMMFIAIYKTKTNNRQIGNNPKENTKISSSSLEASLRLELLFYHGGILYTYIWYIVIIYMVEVSFRADITVFIVNAPQNNNLVWNPQRKKTTPVIFTSSYRSWDIPITREDHSSEFMIRLCCLYNQQEITRWTKLIKICGTGKMLGVDANHYLSYFILQYEASINSNEDSDTLSKKNINSAKYIHLAYDEVLMLLLFEMPSLNNGYITSSLEPKGFTYLTRKSNSWIHEHYHKVRMKEEYSLLFVIDYIYFIWQIIVLSIATKIIDYSVMMSYPCQVIKNLICRTNRDNTKKWNHIKQSKVSIDILRRHEDNVSSQPYW